MSEHTTATVECPICGDEFDPSAAGGWCTNSECGEWRYDGDQSAGDDEEDPWITKGSDEAPAGTTDGGATGDVVETPDDDQSGADDVAGASDVGQEADEPATDSPAEDEQSAATGADAVEEALEDHDDADDGADDQSFGGAAAPAGETTGDTPDDPETESEVGSDAESDAADADPDAADVEADAGSADAGATAADAGSADAASGADASAADEPSMSPSTGDLEECPECSTDVDDDDSFCPSCGEDLDVYRGPDPLTACPDCGTGVDEDDRFCPSCGTDLDDHRDESDAESCPSCGTDVDPDDKFCSSCGADLDADAGIASPSSLALTAHDQDVIVEDGDTVGRQIRSLLTEAGRPEEEAIRVHREHVRFVRDDDGFHVVDLGENPTRLNGQTLTKGDREPIGVGDELTLSDVVTLEVERP